MYLDHFGLSRFPFTIAPDPEFLFPSSGHQEALAHLQYALSGHGGLICLTGEVGTGKTTLCRAFLASDAPDIKTAYIFNPQLSARELLQALCDELGIGYDTEDSQKALYARLNEALLDWYAQGQRVICVIDEAQSMPAPLLEQIRLLTNLETSREKLLTLILVGQPELRDILARHELRQLNQRITARYHLNHLGELETQAYLKHRLATAGCSEPVFDATSSRIIWRGSQGVPRLINSVADRALLGAYANGLSDVTPAIAKRALEEVIGEQGGRSASHARLAGHPPGRSFSRALLPVALVGIVVLAAGGYLTFQKPDALTSVLATETATVAADPEQATATVTAPTSDDVKLAANQKTEQTASAEDGAESTPAEPERDGPESVLATAMGVPGGDCDTLATSGWQCSWVAWSKQQLVDAGIPVAVKSRGDGSWRAVMQATHRDLNSIHARKLVAWHPPAGYRRGIKPGSRGAIVQWVRRQLGVEWHGGWQVIGPQGATNAKPDETLYDPLLANKVMEFQVKHGLDADKILGPQTLVFLQRYPQVQGGEG